MRFSPTKGNQIWRIKTNEELDKLIKHKNIQWALDLRTQFVPEGLS